MVGAKCSPPFECKEEELTVSVKCDELNDGPLTCDVPGSQSGECKKESKMMVAYISDVEVDEGLVYKNLQYEVGIGKVSEYDHLIS